MMVQLKVPFVSALIFLLIFGASVAFQVLPPIKFSSILKRKNTFHRLCLHHENSRTTRRMFGFGLLTLTNNFTVQQGDAVVMEQPKENFFEVGVALDVDVAKTRFLEARRTLDELINNYDVISRDGGDNVRRYLGTVGTTSALYGIDKVLKELLSEAEDIVEYSENMEEFVYYLKAADTACYSANFVEFSAAKTKPEKFLNDAKSDCKNMLIYMSNMAVALNL